MEVRERILENALDLFMRKGCKSVTMDDLANENGISKRTLYEYFTDKSSLLEECLLRSEQKNRCFFDKTKIETENVLEQLLKLHDTQSEVMINLKINFFTELRKFYPLVYDKLVKRMITLHLEVTLTGLKGGQKQGLFRTDIDNELVARIIMELANSMSNADLFPLNTYGRKQLFQEVLINYFRGISTQKGIEIIDNYLNKSTNRL